MDPFHLAVGQNRCPCCGQGALFKSWLSLHECCSVCGARYFRDPGNWTAPTAFGYGVGATAAVLAMVVMWFVNGLAAGSEFIIIGVALVATLASMRHIKAWWVAVLTRMGHVYPDPVAVDSEPGVGGDEPSAASASDAGPERPDDR